jgi:hypothetical protein
MRTGGQKHMHDCLVKSPETGFLEQFTRHDLGSVVVALTPNLPSFLVTELEHG